MNQKKKKTPIEYQGGGDMLTLRIFSRSFKTHTFRSYSKGKENFKEM